MPVAKMLKPGLQTTVQDLGRPGYRHLGVPVSGGIDQWSLRAANLLVGNDQRAAALEITMAGPQLLFLRDCVIAVTGGETGLDLSGRRAPMWESFFCAQGDILSFGLRKSGCRSYMAIASGIDVPLVLGSRSTFLTSGFGGYNGRILQGGDLIRTLPGEAIIASLGRKVPPHIRPVYLSEIEVKVMKGIHAEKFSRAEYAKLLTSVFTVTTRQNRMGCFLAGSHIAAEYGTGVMDSYPVSPGSIQVLPSGDPVVLLNDAQSTGGYPQIACVASAELWKIGQAKPGDKIFFAETGIEYARDLLRQKLSDMPNWVEDMPEVSFCHKSNNNQYHITLYQSPENRLIKNDN